MARTTTATSVNDIILNAVRPVLARSARSIAAAMAEMAAAEVEKQLAGRRGIRGHAGRAARSRPRAEELTKWVADRNARRVPNFVIEMTGGIDTKKKIVAKFGENATFEKGKPLPQAKPAAPSGGSVKSAARSAAKVVKARPPIVRKGGAAARP